MTVRALLFASLKDAAGAREVEEELAIGSTVADLSARLSARFPRLGERLRTVRVAVNEAIADPSRVLEAGDEVAYLPAVSGGAPEPDTVTLAATGPLGMVRLQEGPVSTDEVLASVRRTDCGAVVLFLGTVRDDFQGQQVTGMDYEAYGPLAEHAMTEICEQARTRWPIRAVSVVHRVGALALGDISVAVAAAAPHRPAAFEAGRFIIDRLKEVVPIWKREHLADGAVWIEGDERIPAQPQ